MARAFTNAFVHAKVVEIRSQLDNCWNCTCGLDGPVCELLSDANFTTCMRRAGTLNVLYIYNQVLCYFFSLCSS